MQLLKKKSGEASLNSVSLARFATFPTSAGPLSARACAESAYNNLARGTPSSKTQRR